MSAEEFGEISAVVRSEWRTTAAVAEWQEMRHAPEITGLVSPLRAQRDLAPVLVCLYRGSFVTPTGPPPLDGSTGRPHDLIRVLVLADNSLVLDAAGYADRMSLETPSDWAARRSP